MIVDKLTEGVHVQHSDGSVHTSVLWLIKLSDAAVGGVLS